METVTKEIISICRKRRFRIGIRRSPHALRQAVEIKEALKKVCPLGETSIIRIGGKDKSNSSSRIEGRDTGALKLNTAVRNKKIDCAIHIAKDVPDLYDPELRIAAITTSIDRDDVLVSRKKGLTLGKLPRNALIGASRACRKRHLQVYRSDLKVVDIRGTIKKQLALLDAGKVDALVLSAARLVRLGLAGRITHRIPQSVIKSPPQQGSIAIVVRRSDTQSFKVFHCLDQKHMTVAGIRRERLS